MANIVKAQVGNVVVWIEADVSVVEKTAPQRVDVRYSMGAPVNYFESISETIRAYCSSLVGVFEEMPGNAKPTKVTAEFGLKLSRDLNVYVAKTVGEASLKVTAQWDLK